MSPTVGSSRLRKLKVLLAAALMTATGVVATSAPAAADCCDDRSGQTDAGDGKGGGDIPETHRGVFHWRTAGDTETDVITITVTK